MHLERVRSHNPAVNALVCCDVEGALAEARRQDASFARGESLGQLAGVPITVKDLFEVSGMPSTSGTRGRVHYRPPLDATIVTRLRQAGAIVIGKSNTPEFGMALETTNLVHGTTNNPFDLTKTPGGSSGGSAASLAAGFAVLELGSDGGGSIRMPAHFCGVTGIKPTANRVSNAGHFPLLTGIARSMAGYGPMARNVADLMLALRLLLGEDPRDPNALPDFAEPDADLPLRGLRVAFYTDNGIRSPTDETQALVRLCAQRLEVAGASVVEARPPELQDAVDIHFGLLIVDRAVVHEWKQQAGTDQLHPWVEAGAAYLEESAESFDSSTPSLLNDDWEQFKRAAHAFMQPFDVLLSPVAPGPALPHEEISSAGNLDWTSYSCIQNLTGWPAVSVRCGTSPEGLPLGVQVSAKAFRDTLALRVAAFLEAELGGFSAPSLAAEAE